MEPSVFQNALFGYNSGIVLSPPFWVPLWILVAVQYVLAFWIGRGLLGYEAKYPEYSTECQRAEWRGKKPL